MASVELLKSVGGNDKGSIINIGSGAAEHLVQAGYAKTIEDSKPKQRKTRATKSDTRPGGGGDSQADEASTAG